MQAVLGEQHMGQQVRAGTAARDWMRRRRRLDDRFAFAARELLAHMLDDLPASPARVPASRYVFAELAEIRRSRHRRWAGDRRCAHAANEQAVVAGPACGVRLRPVAWRLPRDLFVGLVPRYPPAIRRVATRADRATRRSADCPKRACRAWPGNFSFSISARGRASVSAACERFARRSASLLSDIVRQRVSRIIAASKQIGPSDQPIAGFESPRRTHPAACGRHVCSGARQSIPSRIYPNCAGDIDTAPSAGVGQMKRPRSNLLDKGTSRGHHATALLPDHPAGRERQTDARLRIGSAFPEPAAQGLETSPHVRMTSRQPYANT